MQSQSMKFTTILFNSLFLIVVFFSYAQDGKKPKNDDKSKLEKYKKAVERIKFPSDEEFKKYAEKGGYFKKAVDIIQDKNIWVESIRLIDEKTGLFREDEDIKVTLGKFQAPAMGGYTHKEGGFVKISMDVMAQLMQRNEQLKGKGSITRVDTAIAHELTHVYQYNKASTPNIDWFKEGMASYVEQDISKMGGYKNRTKNLPSIDDNISERDSYARGWLFFEYLEANFSQEKVREFISLVCYKQKSFQEAAETVTKIKWNDIKAKEHDWSNKYLKEYKPKK